MRAGGLVSPVSEYQSASRTRVEKVRAEVLAVAGRVEVLRREYADDGALSLLNAALSSLRAVAEVAPAPESGVRRLLGEHTQDVRRRVETNRGDRW